MSTDEQDADKTPADDQDDDKDAEPKPDCVAPTGATLVPSAVGEDDRGARQQKRSDLGDRDEDHDETRVAACHRDPGSGTVSESVTF